MVTQPEFDELSARVTALIMLVEALYVDELSKDANPRKIADAIIVSALAGEKKARAVVGETDYALRISDAITSLLDRVVHRIEAKR